MTDPDVPVLEPEQSPANEPIRYVEWVHIADPGWYSAEPGARHGAVTVAWKLYFDGVKVDRHRGERSDYAERDDPWYMQAQPYRELISSWQAHGGATIGTELTFWVGGDDVEIVTEDVTRLRVKVCGRDVLVPLGAPLPVMPQDPRMPVQVVMFVNRLTIGPDLDSEFLWPDVEREPYGDGDDKVREGYERARREVRHLLAEAKDEGMPEPGRLGLVETWTVTP